MTRAEMLLVGRNPDEVGVAVTCAECGRTKKPIGHFQNKESHVNVTLKTIAETQLVESGGDKSAALPKVLEQIEAAERKKIQDDALRAASWAALGTAARKLRAKFFKPSQTQYPKETEGTVRAFRSIAYHNWYGCPLPNGVLLGDATKDQLMDARESWQRQAETNSRRAEWAGRLAERLTGKKTVREQLTEEQLESLKGDVSLEAIAA